MAEMDSWNEHGFGSVARKYLRRLPIEPQTQCDIADNGDLVTRRKGKVRGERHALAEVLGSPSWLDPATKDPKL